MKTVFVVDDNSVNLLVVEEALSDFFEVITISSVPTMFELFENIIPDLILLDIMMPDISGFDAMEQLKANAQYAQIPVFFLTSKSDADTEAVGYKMGAVDFIKKPFSRPALLERVIKFLEPETLNTVQ